MTLQKINVPLALNIECGLPRIDTRLLARQLNVQHHNTLALIGKYKFDFSEFGKVLFKTEPLPDSRTGQMEKYALLNEDQSYLLLAYSRNTARVRELKIKLVKAFSEARRAAIQRGVEYLPAYHELHDQIGALAAGSPNERFVHINVNKLLNKAVGIGAGQRKGASVPTQSLLIAAQNIATRAMHGATDHHQGYSRAKAALQSLSGLIEGRLHVT